MVRRTIAYNGYHQITLPCKKPLTTTHKELIFVSLACPFLVALLIFFNVYILVFCVVFFDLFGVFLCLVTYAVCISRSLFGFL